MIFNNFFVLNNHKKGNIFYCNHNIYVKFNNYKGEKSNIINNNN